MNASKLALTLCLALAITSAAFAKSDPADTTAVAISDPALSPVVNAAVEKLIADKKLAGAVVLVAQDGKIRHLQAQGVRRLGGTDAMGTNTIFRIHSMTKAIVSAAALQQLERGSYQLSDPVAKYIPAFKTLTVWSKQGEAKAAKQAMTVEDLFRHTSGLAYSFTAPPALVKKYEDPKLRNVDLEQYCDGIAAIPLVHEPGEGWTYSVSTDVLGRLIEIWSGQPLDEYLAEEFFQPLGMVDSGFWIEDEAKLARFASVHYSSPAGLIAGKDPFGKSHRERPKKISGGGGLLSTAPDYYRFLQMIANGGSDGDRTFLKPETVAMMSENRLPASIPQIAFGPEKRFKIGFGLGFSIVTGPSKGWDEAAPTGEFGWGGAASCHYWVSPGDDNLIVVTLEQTMPFNWNMERALKPVVYRAVRK